MRSYNVDHTAAREANQANYINESGKYTGHIVYAEAVKSRNGTDGVEISFKSNAGQMANFLTLWTFNSKGEALYGLKAFNALMVCAGVQSLTPAQQQITDARGDSRSATIFPELSGRPIGLVLQKEFYIKNDGSEGYRFNIFAPFQHHTELIAKEILDSKTAPQALANIVSTLSDKAAPQPSGSSRTPQRAATNSYASAQNGNYPDDPFGNDFGGGF